MAYAISYLPKKDKSYRSSSYRLLGMLLKNEENISDALNAYNKAIQILSKEYRNYEERGRLFYDLDLYGLALDDFFSAIKLDASAGDSYLGAAKCFYVLDMMEKAYRCIDLGIKECPTNSDL